MKKITKAARTRLIHEEFGRCVALTEKEAECRNWGLARVNDRSYCGQHYASVVNRELKASREAARKAKIDQRIDRFIEWSAGHPSVWDRMPVSD